MTVLAISQASASPWGPPLLRDIDLSLDSGQIAGVIGPNGAGKTSLLRLAAGDFWADSGTVLLADRPLCDWPAGERARRLAYLPQLSLLNFPYTVEEVILLGRTPHATGQRTDLAIIEELLVLTDIAHLRQRLYTRLSGGERQRVQLARVLAQIWRGDSLSGQLLLLDEPTTALDLTHQQQLLCILELLAERGCAVLLCLHDFNLVSAIADQLIVLQDGQQVIAGTTAEVLRPEMFQQVFATEVTIQPHPGKGHPLVIPR